MTAIGDSLPVNGLLHSLERIVKFGHTAVHAVFRFVRIIDTVDLCLHPQLLQPLDEC